MPACVVYSTSGLEGRTCCMRVTNWIEARIIDFIHRAGEGEAEKGAIVDYFALVEGYSEGHISRALHDLARDGLLERDYAGGPSPATYAIDYDAMCEDDGL